MKMLIIVACLVTLVTPGIGLKCKQCMYFDYGNSRANDLAEDLLEGAFGEIEYTKNCKSGKSAKSVDCASGAFSCANADYTAVFLTQGQRVEVDIHTRVCSAENKTVCQEISGDLEREILEELGDQGTLVKDISGEFCSCKTDDCNTGTMIFPTFAVLLAALMVFVL